MLAHQRRGLGPALRQARHADRVADVALVAAERVVQRDDRTALAQVLVGVVVERAHDRHRGDAVDL